MEIGLENIICIWILEFKVLRNKYRIVQYLAY